MCWPIATALFISLEEAAAGFGRRLHRCSLRVILIERSGLQSDVASTLMEIPHHRIPGRVCSQAWSSAANDAAGNKATKRVAKAATYRWLRWDLLRLAGCATLLCCDVYMLFICPIALR